MLPLRFMRKAKKISFLKVTNLGGRGGKEIVPVSKKVEKEIKFKETREKGKSLSGTHARSLSQGLSGKVRILEIKDNNFGITIKEETDSLLWKRKDKSPTHRKEKTNIKNQCFILGKNTQRAFSKELTILEKNWSMIVPYYTMDTKQNAERKETENKTKKRKNKCNK